MMNPAELRRQAAIWLKAWNAGDLTTLMDHYADDVELASPFVTERWKLAEGRITGKQKVQEHFQKAFDASPERNLEVVDFLMGVNGFIVVYKNKTGTLSANVVELNESGKVKTVKAYYSKIN